MSSQSILDSRESIAKLDTQNMLGSLEQLAKQVKHAWEDTQAITVALGENIQNVVIAGMGGSGLGADVIKHLYKEQLQVPLDYVHNYTLPNYVNKHSLVVLASYSGTTEEILACADDAEVRGAQIMVIAAGGALAERAAEKQWPIYIIQPKYNPSNQPRMAIGYAVFGTIALLAKAGIISVTQAEIDIVTTTIETKVLEYSVEQPTEENPAKTLAYTLIDRRPTFVASDFLEGAVHVSVNQHNENAKVFASYVVVPEMNHHLLEGLQFPKSNASTDVFVFLHSLLYQPQNSIRMHLSQEIVQKNDIDAVGVPLQAQTKIAQVFELITLLGFTGFYLAMLEGIDPSPIPFVEDFKISLKEKIKDLR